MLNVGEIGSDSKNIVQKNQAKCNFSISPTLQKQSVYTSGVQKPGPISRSYAEEQPLSFQCNQSRHFAYMCDTNDHDESIQATPDCDTVPKVMSQYFQDREHQSSPTQVQKPSMTVETHPQEKSQDERKKGGRLESCGSELRGHQKEPLSMAQILKDDMDILRRSTGLDVSRLAEPCSQTRDDQGELRQQLYLLEERITVYRQCIDELEEELCRLHAVDKQLGVWKKRVHVLHTKYHDEAKKVED